MAADELAKASKEAPSPARTGEDKNKKSGVAEYLASPRRKRRSYIILAASPTMPAALTPTIEHFIRTQFKSAVLVTPKSTEELTRLFNRQIVLIIYDDEFTAMGAGLELISTIKRKKSAAAVPVLFLTRRPDELVDHYNKTLLPFHESDDYINYMRATHAQILGKIKNSLTPHNRRRSRRYKIDMPIAYYSLLETTGAAAAEVGNEHVMGIKPLKLAPSGASMDDDEKEEAFTEAESAAAADASGAPRSMRKRLRGSQPRRISTSPVGIEDPSVFYGRLLDLSIHGGMLVSDDNELFELGEQLKLVIPTSPYISPLEGEYLHISARVRRVFIGGTKVGISFEHLSDRQFRMLSQFLMEIVGQQVMRRTQNVRPPSTKSS